MDYLEKFNQSFREFMEDLQRVIPEEDAEFRMYQLAIQAAMMLQPRTVSNIFHDKVVAPYGDHLLARDESFFLSHTYDEVKGEHVEAAAVIDRVKKYWTIISQEDKEVVWKYFRVLILLSKKIST
jgi:hypothetical protein